MVSLTNSSRNDKVKTTLISLPLIQMLPQRPLTTKNCSKRKQRTSKGNNIKNLLTNINKTIFNSFHRLAINGEFTRAGTERALQQNGIGLRPFR